MKKFFNKLVLFLKGLIVNLDTWIHDHVQPSIELVERLKSMVDSPVANIITALIPGDLDDKIKNALSVALGKALDALYITHDIVNEPDLTSRVYKFLQWLKTLTPIMRNKMYFALASELAKELGGREQVKGHSIDLLTQLQYSKMKEGVKADDLPNEMLVDGDVQKLGE